eukprot:816194-Prorocentrum_minimum.AAC.2
MCTDTPFAAVARDCPATCDVLSDVSHNSDRQVNRHTAREHRNLDARKAIPGAIRGLLSPWLCAEFSVSPIFFFIWGSRGIVYYAVPRLVRKRETLSLIVRNRTQSAETRALGAPPLLSRR